ncbi:serine/threonine-protein phosphatase 2A 56 kDa regulatory subunit alpha isoform-like [Scaptodrosophila lebanonensis]|uniref:Serine/threonine-protein phosphatase 2A 56 kDa regulatory subunit alpha isoform-like n=1 Tax=Drosophila lebanonensis TaxID=7225 RepID=A0A6J2U530_DROLE|nr:serine/threonine-protein phosphatase 2A 56 kDa regulatory subunit alpha isoform-like [Scaptodrosophila lebanonensis]
MSNLEETSESASQSSESLQVVPGKIEDERLNSFLAKVIEGSIPPEMCPSLLELYETILLSDIPAKKYSPKPDVGKTETECIPNQEAYLTKGAVHSLLTRMLMEENFNYSLYAYALNKRFMDKMFELFRSPDYRERGSVTLELNIIYQHCEPLRVPMFSRVKNDLMDYQQMVSFSQDYNTVAAMLNLLSDMLLMEEPLPPGEPAKLLSSVLLPLHKHPHLTIFQAELVDAIVHCELRENSFGPVIAKYFLIKWPHTAVEERSTFDFFVCVMKKMPFVWIDPIVNLFFRRLTHCLISHCEVVHETAWNFTETGFGHNMTQQYEDEFLEVVLSKLIKPSIEHWSRKVRCNLGLMLARIDQDERLKLFTDHGHEYWPNTHKLRHNDFEYPNELPSDFYFNSD